MSPGQTALEKYIKEMVEFYGGIRPAARVLHANPGLISYVLNGNDSPMLRKQLSIPKYPKRDGIFISCPPEIKARYDNQRGKTPRAKHLVDLMDLKDGIGEVL